MPALEFAEMQPHRSRYGILLALAAAVALATACSDDDDDPTPPGSTGSISGRVVADGAGVPDANVSLAGPVSRSATTDDEGDYLFEALPLGDYTLTVMLPDGFELAEGQSASQTASVSAGGSATVNWTADGGSAVRVVRLSANAFSPQSITIAAGTTVRWEVDVGAHTVTPDDATQPGAWTGTGTIEPGDTFEHTFDQAGQTYPYHCVFHRATGMTGTVVVQ